MSSVHSAQRDLKVLHPAIRKSVAEIVKKLNDEGHPFKVFEAYRSPQRQEFLYAQGRTRKGSKVTWVQAWGSYHQYGLAADFVLFVNGNWSWDDTGKWAKSWKRLHEVGDEFGMEPIPKEKPHLQIKGVSIEKLKAGRYPPDGDAAWAENLEGMIVGWGKGAPPAPPEAPSRPPIEGGEEEMDDIFAPSDGPRPPASTLSLAEKFNRVQAVVEKWEGGFVNHPLDRGGATNMGITQATLSRWRGRQASVADVRALSREEARQIMKANYYDVVRGDDLPLPVALAAHNAAVLHGPKRSGEFLQKALIAIGLPVEFDGDVGDETIGAVSRAVPSALAKAFFVEQREYFRGIERSRPAEWAAFGRGWMNRFNEIVDTAGAFAAEQGVPEMRTPDLPETPQKPSDLVSILLGGLLGGKAGGQATPPPAGDSAEAIRALLAALGAEGKMTEPQLKALVSVLTGQTAGEQLTQVNGALGQTVGKLLDGRKTGIGIIGSLLVTLLGQAPTGFGGSVLGPLVTAIGGSSGVLLPIMLAIGGWGLLGKVDKWVKLAKS